LKFSGGGDPNSLQRESDCALNINAVHLGCSAQSCWHKTPGLLSVSRQSDPYTSFIVRPHELIVLASPWRWEYGLGAGEPSFFMTLSLL
jgi:hypothetical protein